MSGLYLHDGRRGGALTRTAAQITAGVAAGAVITPFDTPRISQPRKPSAAEYVQEVQMCGGEVVFDPATHGVLSRGANRFDLYDDWNLWPGTPGERSEAALRDHARRAVKIQQNLSLTPRAPTVPLVSPNGQEAGFALAMADETLMADSAAHLSVVGTADFWSAGNALDTFIGQLAQLRPEGWFVVNLRPRMDYPWLGTTADEIAGMCRSVHSMSLRSHVFAAQGDLASLPLLAAGADTFGSGWDLRQRTCSEDAYRKTDGIRRQSERVTYEGLMAALKRQEAERLEQGDRALSRRLLPGGIPAPGNPVWQHHLRVLSGIGQALVSINGRKQRVDHLRSLYQAASADFRAAEPQARPLEAGAARWITPFSQGLEMYAAGEGY